ncbi:potassium-transporting ATPase subunit KdpC [Nocardiopsis dassonvillei]|uniref:Potassium-transporting ATPase KdpC subunit n=1 Tax=Nocardiopsis dassonvillei (strain ATCC 23218 / DSM 43111 / CIP 107115 / JCM 7437 / KCTC 9190 / NBRC 14626 / NCTC 10488 / NRRL B-5397 / IMRU 509) TaxID=446468 RepID=D7B3Y1_NOCDD|nr:potassium-transporting ATPase subunit KdpC [Nocardiopsis dassonvillei]ADH66942.1 potassium-transporting ATPase, C subunit [Nocardiopsis dassonvillei subsp. dassonvillei DSM 43111]NKY80355.1 potassium-transporting ATPase subunit KdpC [Nocardiopsis dassonvillei]VEI86726.1 potassium-transporting ATPase subunit C [Nocardiopsis dassonvillei]
MSSTRAILRQFGAALRAVLVLTLVLGLAYPLAATLLAQTLMPARADGSLLRAPDGTVVGSALIGQSFTGSDGRPLPEWFQSRPSAAGDGHDAGASGGSNLGPENPGLVAAVEERREAVTAFEGVDPDRVPMDALTASASGLDPHISPEYALLQVPRVAEARGLPEGELRALVGRSIEGRDLGFLGEERVNVLELNIALDRWGS